ncbi:MAG: DUF11 domain-containing protein [bacterium]|nr:DUF11 domain-containing protein [bacterium]
MKTTFFSKTAVVALITAVVLSGCASTKKSTEGSYYKGGADLDVCMCEGKKPHPEHKPVVAPAGSNRVAFYYPCGKKECSVLYVEKIAPKIVQVGESFSYQIIVTNVLGAKLTDVVLTDVVDSGFKVSSSNPSATSAGSNLSWDLGTLMPNETKEVSVSGTASGTGTITNCIKATYTPMVCVVTQVVQPNLGLSSTAPAEILKCDKLPLTLVVKNTGSGFAQNVKVTAPLPEGLTTVDGQNSISESLGSLDTGEARTISKTLVPSKPGTYTVKAKAEASGNLMSQSETTTVVRQPILSLAKTGPEELYIGRTGEYSITVKNTGDGVAANTVIQDVIPSNMAFVSASNGGKAVTGKVQWDLGSLAPNASETVTMKLNAVSQGSAKNTAVAFAECSADAPASAVTEVKGIPAILMEVIDVDDPVEIGAETTYVITITNQGSAPATNVKIIGVLEENTEYVSSSGESTAELKGKEVEFAPIPSIPAKGVATLKVQVKALKAGDTRFKVKLNSDQLTRTVEETESTTMY